MKRFILSVIALMLILPLQAQVQKPQYLSRWISFNTETADGRPASVVVDLGLMRLAPVEGYPYQCSFLIYLQSPDSTGLNETLNPERLWQVEEKLTTAITRSGGVYYGMVTAAGMRDYYFYLSDTAHFNTHCQQVMAAFPEYTFQTEAELDPYWFNYYNVYPDDYTNQIQYNAQMQEELLGMGDSLAAPRTVEHFANFRTERDRDAYEREVQSMGFYILGKGQNEGELKYGIVITKKHPIDTESIEEVSLRLIDICAKNGGYYDGWEAEPVVKK